MKAVLLLLITALALSISLFGFSASAAPNYNINYQGKLTDNSGVAVADGTYEMEFNLYTQPDLGSPIWTELLDGADEVTVSNGLFSIMLGSTSPLTSVNFDQTLYLGVTIEGDSEMTPRKVLGAVPAAFFAEEASTLGGVASTSFLRSDEADIMDELLTFTNGFVSNSSSSIANLMSLNATVDNLYLDGAVYDATGSEGQAGYVLWSTGTSTEWVATTSLGFASAGSSHDAVTLAGTPNYLTLSGQEITLNALDLADDLNAFSSANLLGKLSDETGSGLAVFATNPLLSGFRSNASSTIGDGTEIGGLTILGGATTTGNAYFASTTYFKTGASAADPSIAFSANPDTGIQYSATNGGRMDFIINGSSAGWVQNDGFGSFLPIRADGGTTANPDYRFGNDSDSGMWNDHTTSNTGFSTDGIERIRIMGNAGNGFIGIGTTSPYAKLSVVGEVVGRNFTATSTSATSTFAGGLNVNSGAILHDFTSGLTSIDNLAIGTLSFDADSGIISWVDMPVTSASATGTVNSYSAQLDGNALLTIYGIADGSGGIVATSTAVGIGTTSPWRTLTVEGTMAVAGLSAVSGTDQSVCIDPVTFEITTQSGDTCAVSSERYKNTIEPLADSGSGLDMLRAFEPVSFIYNEDTASTTHWGFIAERMADVSPQLAAFNPDGSVQTINSLAITSVLTQAMKELDLNLSAIAGDYSSSTPASENFATTFFSNLNDRLSEWFASVENGIGDFFVNRLRAREEICIDDQCLTKEDIQALIDITRNGQTTPPDSPPDEEPEPTPEPDPTPEPEIIPEEPVTEPEPTPEEPVSEPEPTPEPAPEPTEGE